MRLGLQGYAPDCVLARRDELHIERGWVTEAEFGSDLSEFAGAVALDTARYDRTHLFVNPAYLGCGIGARLLRGAQSYVAQGGQPTGAKASKSISGRELPCFEFT
jgi:GNAT superfamily N-acetyltransferase